MGYTGSVDLVSGIRPKNNGAFPLVDAKDVRVDDNTRLDAALANASQTAAGAVRFDIAQTLTDAQKQQARENIGAGEVDDTLSIEGMAADAKKTGDEITALKGDLSESVIEQLFTNAVTENETVEYDLLYTNNTMNDNTGEQSIETLKSASTPSLYYFPYYCELRATWNATNQNIAIYCYDENKVYLGYVISGNITSQDNGLVNLKDGTRYVRFFIANRNGSDISTTDAKQLATYTCVYIGRLNEMRLESVEVGLSEAQSYISDLMSVQDISIQTVNQGYVKTTDGTIVNNANYSHIVFSVLPGRMLHYKTNTNESVAGIVFYNKYEKYLSGFIATNADQTIEVPNEATIAKATFRTAEQSGFYVKLQMKSEDVANNLGLCNDTYIFLHNGKIGKVKNGYANINTGSYSTNAGYKSYEIAVFPGEEIQYKTGTNESVAGIVFYDEERKYISGVAASTLKQIITVPETATTAIVAFRANQADNLELETAYPLQAIANSVNTNLAYKPQFVLPLSSVAIVGHEWNCYFDNVIRGMDFEKYAVYVRSISGSVSSKKCFSRFLRILPEASDIGDHVINMQIVDKKYCTVVDDASITLHIIADGSVTGKKVMFIGDSLTDAGVYPAEIQYNLSNGGIESVGTRQDTVTIGANTFTVKHEGRGGWASYDYTRSRQNYRTDADNPFWDGQKFSFTYYMSTSGITKPDIVCIGLGTNGGSGGIADVLTMVESIHEYDSTIPVLVSLITPPAGQDGCGYATGIQSAAMLKKDFLDVNAAYIGTYESGLNTDIAELYFHFDREHDFDTASIPASARNPETMIVQTNNVHPSVYGYLHFADGYYNRILYHLT